MIPHDGYMYQTMENDIAILKLSNPLVFNKYVQPACLPNLAYPYATGETVIISGWGTLTEGGSSPDILNVATVPLIAQEQCNTMYEVYGYPILNGMVCAAFSAGKAKSSNQK